MRTANHAGAVSFPSTIASGASARARLPTIAAAVVVSVATLLASPVAAETGQIVFGRDLEAVSNTDTLLILIDLDTEPPTETNLDPVPSFFSSFGFRSWSHTGDFRWLLFRGNPSGTEPSGHFAMREDCTERHDLEMVTPSGGFSVGTLV